MQPTERKLTLEEAMRRLSRPAAAPRTEEISPLRWEYRTAACVLSSFEPTTLRIAGPPEVQGHGLQHLMDDCETVPSSSGPKRWTLRQSVREAAIARLGTREALLRALDLNAPPEPDLLQQTLASCLRGTARPLGEQRPDELACTLRVVHWFRPVLPELPSPEEVRERLEQGRLMEPFRYLAGERFCGRKEELQTLRDYVGLINVSFTQSVLESTRDLLGVKQRAPLLVHGPGGMGKSALLSRFLLEHTSGDVQVPFAYLDFDDPTLTPHRPETLLAEAARQLAQQFPRLRPWADHFRWVCEEPVLRSDHAQVYQEGFQPPENVPQTPVLPRSERDYVGMDAPTTVTTVSNLYGPLPTPMQARRELVRVFGMSLAQIPYEGKRRRRPFLLILDTFEEVQFRGSDLVDGVRTFLSWLQASYPELRTVICGRAPEPTLDAKSLPLIELDEDSARELLRLNGLTDSEVIHALVSQLGGNPLTLKLAADVALHQEVGRDGISGLKTRRLFLFSAREAIIQGQLYRRILDHIHDPKVRKLAHPGLTVRRITPEIIEQVLAGPCGLSLEGPQQAAALFSALQREVSLVSPAADGSLHHRTDVRRIMLDALRAEMPVRVSEIHENAISYYAGKQDLASRAEELYHRLALGQPAELVDPRWMKGVEQFLLNAVDEVPVHVRPYLATRLGLELSKEVRVQAGLADWEHGVRRRCEVLLQRGNTEHALSLLGERRERTAGSPLYEIEARALMAENRAQEALEVVEQGLASAMPAAGESTVPLLLLRAELASSSGELALADESLRDASRLGQRLERPDVELEALVRRAQLEAVSPEQWRERVDALGAFLSSVPDELLRENRRLAQLGISLCSELRPELLARGLAVVGLGDVHWQSPAAFDLKHLLLLMGWPEARGAFESGEADGFLLRVLESEYRPAHFPAWVRRVFAEENSGGYRWRRSIERSPYWPLDKLLQYLEGKQLSEVSALVELIARVMGETRSPEEWFQYDAHLGKALRGASDEFLLRNRPLARIGIGLAAGDHPDLLERGLEVVKLGEHLPPTPVLRGIQNLLLRAGWPEARTDLTSGDPSSFLREVLRDPQHPEDLQAYVALAFIEQGRSGLLGPEAAQLTNPPRS
ncbi:hypothetical protein JRI60_27205 [Archangium violaceum]|uniref:hypothetical protein n=1 Tax=Archangium violaceum TaxID=83451 RepID=UPI00194E5038|nr:hypothetical protein [Archangium violaceum]QRN92901.1 hypothetical protein JRI60_27205 [Archangium violaceum]